MVSVGLSNHIVIFFKWHLHIELGNFCQDLFSYHCRTRKIIYSLFSRKMKIVIIEWVYSCANGMMWSSFDRNCVSSNKKKKVHIIYWKIDISGWMVNLSLSSSNQTCFWKQSWINSKIMKLFTFFFFVQQLQQIIGRVVRYSVTTFYSTIYIVWIWIRCKMMKIVFKCNILNKKSDKLCSWAMILDSYTHMNI